MPQFNTGNADWDQGLGSLSNMLFPDVSKIAQASYYGAESRKARLEGDAMEAQKAALAKLFTMHPQGGPTAQVPGVSAPGNTFAVPPPGPPMQRAPGQMPTQFPGQGSAPGSQTLPPVAPGQLTQLAQTMTQGGIQPGGMGMGQPPPAASPAPGAGAPPMPMTTGSDGSVPPTDFGSGKFAPGSITAPGGGIKMSGPAAANGTPAGALDLGSIVTQALAAGFKGEDVVNRATAYIDEALQGGIIDQNTASQMLASLGRTGQLSSQTQLAQQGIVTGEGARQYNETPMPIIRSNGSIGSVPHNQWYANPDKYDTLDPASAGALATANYAPTSVFKQNPNDGTPDYTSAETVTGREAIRGRRTRTPTDFLPVGTVGKDTGNAETAGYQREFLADRAVEKMYAPGPYTGAFDYSRQEGAELTPQAKSVVMDRATQIFLADPQLRTDQKNFPEAVTQAMTSLQKEGRLPTPQMITKARTRGLTDRPYFAQDQALMNGTDAKGNPAKKFKIDLISGALPQGAPLPTGGASGGWGAGAPRVTSPQVKPAPLSSGTSGAWGASAPAPPQGQGQAPGIPAPGQPENSVHIDPKTRTPLIVHNGVAVPMTPAEMQQFQTAQKQQGQQRAVSGQ